MVGITSTSAALVVASMMIFLPVTIIPSYYGPHRGAGLFNLPHEGTIIIDCDGKVFTMYNETHFEDFALNCTNPKKIRLVHPTVLAAARIPPALFQSFIDAEELDMCIFVEQTEIIVLKFDRVKKHTGNCDGPLLVVTKNEKLENLTFNKEFMNNALSNYALVRGNVKLRALDIRYMHEEFSWYAIDLQYPQECALPVPFESFTLLGKLNCTRSFGAMIVIDTNNMELRGGSTTRFFVAGCIQIFDRDVRNLKFLDFIDKFTYIEYYCQNIIVPGKSLCIKYPLQIIKKFNGMIIDQTENPECDATCDGGVVTVDNLHTYSGCTRIRGDLIFSPMGFREHPKELHSLNSITHIDGQLIVVGTVFEDFSELISLRSIVVPKNRANVPAIKILGNRKLKSLAFPKLRIARAYTHGNTTVIDYNPQLKLTKSTADHLHRVSGDRSYIRASIYNDMLLKSVEIEKFDETSTSQINTGFMFYIIVGVLILLIILLVVGLVIGIVIAKKKRRSKKDTHIMNESLVETTPSITALRTDVYFARKDTPDASKDLTPAKMAEKGEKNKKSKKKKKTSTRSSTKSTSGTKSKKKARKNLLAALKKK